MQKNVDWCDNTAEKMCVWPASSRAACSTDADCGDVSGSCQQTDGNTDGTGWPCRDQIGRGKDQALRPALFWNNTMKVGTDAVQSISATTRNNITTTNPLANGDTTWMATNHVKEGRDFCNHDTSTPCGGMASTYAPYVCPHPLTGLTGSCDTGVAGTTGYDIDLADTTAPAAPTNLVVE